MTDNSNRLLSDEAVVLYVKNSQTVDKYAVCFTRKYGKLRFISYGARYEKNVSGRLLQPFANLHLDLQQGSKIDKLRSCELLHMPPQYDVKQMAYAAVAAELTDVLTEDKMPQPELYDLLNQTLGILLQRNPRLAVLSFAIKLLALTGFAPQMNHCVNCSEAVSANEEVWFSPLQGGIICDSCKAVYSGDGLESCSCSTRNLWYWLEELDFTAPKPFKVLGRDLMELEKLLYKFIFFQTDRQLNSLNFLNQLGI